MRIGIIAALPGELKPLVRGWERLLAVKGSGVRMWQTKRGANEIIAACAGMGATAARRAFTAVEFLGAMDLVLSIGWVGALAQDCKAAECFEVSEVIDAQTGERFQLCDGRLRLVTTVRVANAVEKHRLADSYGATLVDMEAAIVARLAQMRGIPMRCFKAVSDDASAELPDLNPFVDVDGQMRMGRFLAYIALRPGYWGALAALGRHSSVAAANLGLVVTEFIDGIKPISDDEAV